MQTIMTAKRISPLKSACLNCGGKIEKHGRMVREYCSDECKAERKKKLRYSQSNPICTSCGKEFCRTSNRQKYCHACRDKSRLNYSVEYYHTNLDECRSTARRNVSRPEYKAAKNARGRLRNKTDPRYALNRRISSAIFDSIKRDKAGRKWEAVLGYNLDELSEHLERQFTRGMSWENIGDWHIDHIVPQRCFSYANDNDPDFKSCWALTNLRPLWAKDNLRKSGSRIHLI